MADRLMSFNYQIESEAVTQETTYKNFNGLLSKYPKILDALFEINYFIGKANEVESLEGYFYAIGFHILKRFPYTARATCMLIEKGFYYEVISLIRNLYESFIQLRYFHNHPDMIRSHIIDHRIKFRTMFDEIAPGFYVEIYGKQLSEFTHSGFSSAIFRTNYTSPDVGETTMGNKFDKIYCTYSVNLIVPILLGVLNFVPVFFPQYLSLVPNDTEIKRKESIEWLSKAIKDHIAEKPISKNFYDLVTPLIFSSN
jgi:hypothetical protein